MQIILVIIITNLSTTSSLFLVYFNWLYNKSEHKLYCKLFAIIPRLYSYNIGSSQVDGTTMVVCGSHFFFCQHGSYHKYIGMSVSYCGDLWGKSILVIVEILICFNFKV